MNYSFINEMAGAEYETRSQITKRLVTKWGKTGLLKKLKESKAGIMANLLETEAKSLKQLNEASTVADIAGFNKIAFPLVRRVFAQLIANEIVAVQPMSLPSGLLFYLDFQFDRTKSGFAQYGSIYGDKQTPIDNPTLQGLGAMKATGGFYELNSGYSTRSFALTGQTSGLSGTVGSVALSAVSPFVGTVYPVTFNNNGGSATWDLAQLQNIRLFPSSALTLGSGTFRSLTPVETASKDPWYGLYDPTMTKWSAGSITFYATTGLVAGIAFAMANAGNAYDAAGLSGWAPVIVGPAKTDVQDNRQQTSVGDFEAVTGIPQLNITVSSVPVMAQTRKLKTTWTPEMAQDLNAYHALDAEVELTTILSEAIALEIDREILGELIHGASVRAAWSRKIGRYVTLSADGVIVQTNTFAGTTNNAASNATYQAFFGTQQDWYQTLGETITTVSNEIHKRSLRHGANFIVTSPEISSVIESINGFKPSILMDASEVEYSFGMEKAGTLTSRYTVYKDPYFPENVVLLGYKGGSFLETGYVYAPYVPLLVTPTIFAPEDFTPRRAVMTRYAKQMVRPEMYGTIVVTDLDWIGSPASV
jgi:Major capsid protein Gp23